MTRDELIAALAELMAGLAVPVSFGQKLGTATVTWTRLHRELIGAGWAEANDYEREIRKILGPPGRKPI